MRREDRGTCGVIRRVPFLLMLLVATCDARAGEKERTPDVLRDEQQRAAASARRLVAEVLDLQLRQLRENGLQDRPLFAEILSMRDNLEQLVRGDMREVEQLLRQAERGTDQQRRTRIDEARRRIRQIVLSLTDQRARLRRRLGVARLAEQVREAIALQDQVLETTRRLTRQPRESQERETLSAIEDQQDVKALHESLRNTLQETATWPGSVAEAAARGLELLESAHASQDLSAAIAGLRAGRLAEAADRQEKLLSTYRELLLLVQEGRGIDASRPEEALDDSLADLVERQRELSRRTGNAPKREELDALVDEQSALQQDLGQLQDVLPPQRENKALLSSAEAGAMQAAAELFEGKTEAAQEKQQQVITALETLRSRIQDVAGGKQPSGESLADNGATDAPSQNPSPGSPQRGATGEGDVANANGSERPRTAESGGAEATSDAGSPGGSPAAGRAAGSGTEAAGRTAAASAGDGNVAGDREQASWFTRLPPAVREAIRSRVRQRAPRGYEDRLRRYFESVD